jgi:lipid A 3-O-deacylase
MIRKTAFAAALALAFGTAARGADGVSFEVGRGEGTDMIRLGAQWNWDKRFFAERRWNVVPYWDFTVGLWNSARYNMVADLAVTPTFRLQQATLSGLAPYFEAAIGFHLLSEVHITRSKIFSTNFQFGDHIGAGVRFGGRRRYDVSLRLQHLSNGSIRRPNPGINFAQLRLAYHF